MSRLEEEIHSILLKMYEMGVEKEPPFKVLCGIEVYNDFIKSMQIKHVYGPESTAGVGIAKLYTSFGPADIRIGRSMLPEAVTVNGVSLDEIEAEYILLGYD
jgi:hypothetical protein